MFDLTDKVILLTGASGGIGKSIARKMKKVEPKYFQVLKKLFLTTFQQN